MCRNTENNIIFHYRRNRVKLNDQIFQQIQKSLFLALFWSVFPILGAKTFFPENPALLHTSSYGFIAPCQNLVKLMIQFKESTWTMEEKMEGDG